MTFDIWPDVNRRDFAIATLFHHKHGSNGKERYQAYTLATELHSDRVLSANNIIWYYITTHSQTPIFCIVSRVDKRYI